MTLMIKKDIFKKLIVLFSVISLFGCSSDEPNIIKNSVNVFEKNILLPYVNEANKKNSELNMPVTNLNVLNSKSYNLTNSQINFPLEKIWEVDTDQSLDNKTPFLSEPIYVASKIYLVNTNGNLLKIDSQDGKILWEKTFFENKSNSIWEKTFFENKNNSIIGPAALSGEYISQNDVTLYAHDGSNQLISINGVTGAINWKKKFELPFRGGITFSKGRLFLSDYEGNFLSINSNNGQILWSIPLGTDYSSVYTNARPIVAKNKIVVPGTGGSFFVLSSENGEVIWTENISSKSQLPKIFHSGDIVANPIYYDGIIYLVSQSGTISAFDIETAEKIWTLPIGGLETPALSGKTIFVNGNMGIFVAIDRITGRVRWEKKYESYANVDAYFSSQTIAI